MENSSSLIIEDLSNDLSSLKSTVLSLDSSNFADIMRELSEFEKRLRRQELICENRSDQSTKQFDSDRKRLEQLRKELKQVKGLLRNLNRNVELSNSFDLLRQNSSNENENKS